MRSRQLVIPALATGVVLSMGVSGYAAQAQAGAPARAGGAPTRVTIKAEGVDLSGTVSSPHPKKCAKGRTVVVIKQKGARGGGDDVKVGSDTAEKSGGVYRWSTGNTGLEGKFYAKVRAIPGCHGDTSKTIRAVRNN